jgi:glycosyltransferase involved in cell wall biosynthesis
MQTLADYPRLKILKPLKLLPNVVARDLNQRYMRDQVMRALKKLAWPDYTTWINDQKAVRFLPSQNNLIYDITDDWTTFKQTPREQKMVEEDDEWAMQHCGRVIVCSESLLRSKNKYIDKVVLVKNGVDNHRYSPMQLLESEAAADIAEINRPIAGYTGTLHGQRLDVELMTLVAAKMPQVNFVFVGPNCLSKADSERLMSHSNVRILGPRSYEVLPNYLTCFDVCMTPHLVTPFTESLDPLKLYEYMSTGKPIVSTPCAGFRDLDELIFVAKDADQFCSSLQKAIDNPDEGCAQRLTWADSCSWDKRIAEVEAVLGW